VLGGEQGILIYLSAESALFAWRIPAFLDGNCMIRLDSISLSAVLYGESLVDLVLIQHHVQSSPHVSAHHVTAFSETAENQWC